MMLSDLREVYNATEGKDMSSSYVFLALENLFTYHLKKGASVVNNVYPGPLITINKIGSQQHHYFE